MKKILFAIAFVMMMSAGAMAQDYFFKNYDNGYGNRGSWGDGDPGIVVPNGTDPGEYQGENNDPNAPLGSGLLVLTALGAGYAVYRRRNK